MEKNIGNTVIKSVAVGETFWVGGVEFIRFADREGVTPAVTKEFVFKSVFSKRNNLENSAVMARMEKEFLPAIISAVGEENVANITTDLTALDGMKNYGDMESRVSLPTLDFYRENVEIFDRYPVEDWWWLATPESVEPHSRPYWVLCVSPSGFISNCYCNSHDLGVRPFLLFKSSIFESEE